MFPALSAPTPRSIIGVAAQLYDDRSLATKVSDARGAHAQFLPLVTLDGRQCRFRSAGPIRYAGRHTERGKNHAREAIGNQCGIPLANTYKSRSNKMLAATLGIRSMIGIR